MGYYDTPEPEAAPRVISCASPKTHVPGSRVKERGHRYFMPEMGRWVNRDLIDELGGANLYAFAENASVNNCDNLGLKLVLVGHLGKDCIWKDTVTGLYSLAPCNNPAPVPKPPQGECSMKTTGDSMNATHVSECANLHCPSGYSVFATYGSTGYSWGPPCFGKPIPGCPKSPPSPATYALCYCAKCEGSCKDCGTCGKVSETHIWKGGSGMVNFETTEGCGCMEM